MAAKRTKCGSITPETGQRHHQTPTFLLELPLLVNAGQAKRLRGHLEAGRQFYNAALSEGLTRLRRMRADPAWQAARAIVRSQKQERARAFRALREQYGFSEYGLHEAGKTLRISWVADHLDAVLAQTLASRAYHALNRVCLGQAKRIRFRSRGRGLSSIENKRNDTGLRFVLQKPEEGNQGVLLWKNDHLAALIDWDDPVVKHGLSQRIKYARLVQRKASSPEAQGADCQGYRYCVQLVLEGLPYHKPRHTVGIETIGADLGPSSIALVPREAEASLEVFCEQLAPDERHLRRLQRQMERQRRAANQENYDSQGRVKKHGQKRLVWNRSRTYEKIRRRKAAVERKLAGHRKSLHGRMVHKVIAVGNTIILEKLSYARTGGTLLEVPTGRAKLSQFCHGCGRCVKKPLSQRWHQCACGVGPVQRDLYSAFLASTLDPDHLIPSCARAVVPSRRCGGAPAGRTRTGQTTGERGAVVAPKLWHPQSRSPSAWQSEPTHTRASLPAHAGALGSVEGSLRTPRSLDGGAFRHPHTRAAACGKYEPT